MPKTGMKADLRREITAWRLLVWAYADECVRAATNGREQGPGVAASSAAVAYTSETGLARGAINGLLNAHEDAWAIDDFVGRLWFAGHAHGRDFVASAAERRKPPVAADRLERLRAIPLLNARGAPHLLYTDSGKRPYLCLLDWQGHSEAEIAAHDALHRLFVALLDVLPGLVLSKWKVVGRGLTDCGESLTSFRTVRSGLAVA